MVNIMNKKSFTNGSLPQIIKICVETLFSENNLFQSNFLDAYQTPTTRPRFNASKTIIYWPVLVTYLDFKRMALSVISNVSENLKIY